MKIAVLDFDHTHNLRLKTALATDVKTKVVFCQQMTELLEILNPNQTLDAKIMRMEKTLIDGGAMLQKTTDGLTKAQTLLAEKKNQPAQELEAVHQQIKSSEELKKRIEVALAARQKEIDALKAQVVSEEEKKVSLVLVDRSFLGNLPSDWLLKLREQIESPENKEVPVVTMGYNEDLNYIKNTLHGGILDYIVKPADLLLVKFILARITGDSGADSKIFALQAKSEIKILKMATIYKMSEFELYVQVDSSFQKDELVEFYTDVFGGEKGGRVLGKCLKSEPDAGQKGMYNADFSLVGHTPHTMTEMRKWIRAQYVAAKSEGDKG